MVTWKEPPTNKRGWTAGAAGSKRIDAIVEELKTEPGRWALVHESLTQGGAVGLKKRGCETRLVIVKPKPNPRYDIYARWPE
jgi:hypothetical protein